MYHDIYQTSLK